MSEYTRREFIATTTTGAGLATLAPNMLFANP
jgi:hypothetical protein